MNGIFINDGILSIDENCILPENKRKLNAILKIEGYESLTYEVKEFNENNKKSNYITLKDDRFIISFHYIHFIVNKISLRRRDILKDIEILLNLNILSCIKELAKKKIIIDYHQYTPSDIVLNAKTINLLDSTFDWLKYTIINDYTIENIQKRNKKIFSCSKYIDLDLYRHDIDIREIDLVSKDLEFLYKDHNLLNYSMATKGYDLNDKFYIHLENLIEDHRKRIEFDEEIYKFSTSYGFDLFLYKNDKFSIASIYNTIIRNNHNLGDFLKNIIRILLGGYLENIIEFHIKRDSLDLMDETIERLVELENYDSEKLLNLEKYNIDLYKDFNVILNKKRTIRNLNNL
ncbi:hypothetical protein Bp8pS_090 [Bacillus phage vB_BpuM-BpSp]|nr:hypothetical protein Bp8pS_090 [Bacillus phage vB_BpuM-BpSp]